MARARAPKAAPRDIYQEVTDAIIEALETAGEWHRPWSDLDADAGLPRSIDGRPYRGVNTILLWASALQHGYEHGTWGTFKAWFKDRAATPDEIADGTARKNRDGDYRVTTRCVRKDEHGTLVTLWKPTSRRASADEVAGGKADENGRIDGLLLRHFTVFNAAQVEGYEAPAEVERPTGPDAIAHADEFFKNIGAKVTFKGDRAYYSPGTVDAIVIPKLDTFKSAEHFYATQAHEHAHWTGHPSRLARDFSGRFGTEQYAFEELVAELSAAFTGALLGIGSVVRDDHAAYVKNWLRVLRNDKKAIFTAGSHAQKATDYLVNAAGLDEKSESAELAEVA